VKFIIFSDTHGDFSKIEKLKRKYYDNNTIVVFLGDLLDAIEFSHIVRKGTFEKKFKNAYVNALKELKEVFDDNFYFIQGNHDPIEILDNEIKHINLSARYGVFGNLHVYGIPGSSIVPNVENPEIFASFGEFLTQVPQKEENVQLLHKTKINEENIFVYGNLPKLLKVERPVNIVFSHTPPLLNLNFKTMSEFYKALYNSSIGVRVISEKLKPNIIFAGHEHAPRKYSEILKIDDKVTSVIKVGSLSRQGSFAILEYSPETKKMNVKIKKI